MAALPRETFQVVLLDGRHRVIDVSKIAEGRVNTVGASMADVFRDAVRRECPAVILAHNHPSGDPAPSDDDAKLTRTAAEAGKLLGVEVLDHVVIARGPTNPPNFVSLREHGMEW
jgi:DNA repair protein RadC